LSFAISCAAEPAERISLRWDTGAVRVRERFRGAMEQNFGARYQMVHRADLHRLLQSRVPAAAIRAGSVCVGARNVPGGAVARMEDGREIEADIVIGADGLRSAVRRELYGERAPRFTHQICWRIVLPMEELRAAAGKLPIPLTGNEYVGWLGPTGHVICYPVRAGQSYNIFAGRVSDEWASDDWTVPSSTAEVMAAYAGWHPGLLHLLSRAREAFKWGLNDRDPLDQWVRGRIALLGDAAHPMMPTLAQGAAISMEDGAALARRIDERRDDLDAALAAYGAERQPRGSRVQLQARQQFLNNQMAPPPPPLPVDWIYRHDAVTGADFRRQNP
jgi:salicylate hydroxylase